MRRRVTFVLRLWMDESQSIPPDGGRDRPPILRGSLQPVDAEDVRHFASLEQLQELLQGAVDGLIDPDRPDA